MATVTIQEAAQRLGVSQDTVRRRIRKEELQARQTPTPQGFRWVVELEDLEEDAQAAPRWRMARISGSWWTPYAHNFSSKGRRW